MFHLVYKSKATQDFSPSDLKALLLSARIRNREAGVTGILVYDAGWFLQVLEGEQTAVEATFAHIEKDPRHTDISVFNRAPSGGKRRMFGDWAMAFTDAAGVASILKGFVGLKSGMDLPGLDAIQALEVLKAYSQRAAALAV